MNASRRGGAMHGSTISGGTDGAAENTQCLRGLPTDFQSLHRL